MSKSLNSYINVPTVFAITAILISIAVWLYYRNQVPRVDTAPELLPLIEQELAAPAPTYLFSSGTDATSAPFPQTPQPQFTTQGISLQYFAEKNSIQVAIENIQFQSDSTAQDSSTLFPRQQLLQYAQLAIQQQVGALVEHRIRPGINIEVLIEEKN
ncbi:MAG: hypothetical protein AAGG75_20630 [Bacteroidota bacterium]